MQWNIQINQLSIDKYRKENKYKIDGSDAMIIDCIHQFCSTKIAQKNAIKIDDDIYFYLSYQLIIDQLPLLDIENKQVISRRIQKLQEYGIIKTKILKELGNKLYITTTDILNSFYTKTPIDSKVDTLLTQKLIPSQLHSQNPIDSKVDTLLTQKLNNNIDKNNKDYNNKKNNIKKDFDNSVISKMETTQQNVDNEPNLHAKISGTKQHFLEQKNNKNVENISNIYMATTHEILDRSQNAVFIEKNENNVDIVYNKTNDPQFTNYNTGSPAIILDETVDVIVEKIANFTENDIIDSQLMVQQAYCEAGIAIFNDGQNGFGSLLNKNADLWLKSDILMELRHYHKNSQDNIIIICQEKKITYQQLYNVFYDTMYKKKQNILDTKKLLTLNYFITVLQSFNQLTSNQNDNNIQRDTNNSGSGQQNEPSTERYFSAGTTINYGTGAEGLRAIAEAHYK